MGSGHEMHGARRRSCTTLRPLSPPFCPPLSLRHSGTLPLSVCLPSPSPPTPGPTHQECIDRPLDLLARPRTTSNTARCCLCMPPVRLAYQLIADTYISSYQLNDSLSIQGSRIREEDVCYVFRRLQNFRRRREKKRFSPYFSKTMNNAWTHIQPRGPNHISLANDVFDELPAITPPYLCGTLVS